jgi:prepilin-type N-terminal cleavage/methylation domain-containing protein
MASNRGFSLIELMIVISLLAVAFTIMIPLLSWCVTSTTAAQQQTAMGIRFDGIAAMLRADIYTATSAKIRTPKDLALTQPDGGTVHWQIGPGDQLMRANEKWTDLGITDKTTFFADGSAIRLVIPPRPDGSQKTLAFVTQTAAFKEAAR